jgi:mannose-1-phosphate guanylyltransferase/phosphomannomutase
MIEQGVVIAGGLGTRLKEFLPNLPKCINRVGDFTLIEQTCKVFSESGIKRLHLLLGYLSDAVISEIPALGSKYRLDITFSVEQNLLGTGGSLLSSLHLLDEQFLLTYGDLYLDVDLEYLCTRFENSGYDYAQLIHPTNHMHDSDLVKIDPDNNIVGYSLKPRKTEDLVRNRANSGVYVFKKEIFSKFSSQDIKVDLDREILPSLISEGKRGLAVRNLGYVRDAGTIERISKVENDIRSGLTKSRRKPAIFLDRDGTINVSRGYISRPEQIELYEDIPSAIRKFNELGYWVIVITNQPVIARGEASFSDIETIHARIDNILGDSGAYIDDYFVCPHHPEAGFLGEVRELKIRCKCRKPGAKLIENSLNVFPINLEDSFFVGDSQVDFQAATSMGISFRLIDRNSDRSRKSITWTDAVESINSLEKLLSS